MFDPWQINGPIIFHYLGNPNVDSRLDNKEPNAAIVIGPMIAIVFILIIAVVLLIVYIRRRRNVKLKSSGISGSCIVNQGREMNTSRDGKSKGFLFAISAIE